MSFDLALGRTKRNWSRSSLPSTMAGEEAGNTNPSRSTKKILMGGMALAVAGGLAFITSPWWRPLPPSRTQAPPVRRRPLGYRQILRSPSGRIIMTPY